MTEAVQRQCQAKGESFKEIAWMAGMLRVGTHSTFLNQTFGHATFCR